MKLAVLAGNRTLPLFFCAHVRSHQPEHELIVYAFKKETDPRIRRFAHKVYWISPTSLGDLARALRLEGCTQAVMVGQINPLRIFQRKEHWDTSLKHVVEATPDFRPHSIFSRIIHFLENEGIHFLDYSTFLKDHFAHEGPHTRRTFDIDAERISPLLPLIKNIVNLDIGQTTVLKNKTIVAVEAIEGTDNTIRRGYRLAGKGCVVVKSAKDSHDMRFDIPIIGVQTVRLLSKISAQALLVEADKVLFIDKPLTIATADKLKIPLCGISFS